MGYSPSSDFQVEVRKKNPTIVREFTIGGSDYSDFVTKWPTFNQTINDIRPVNVVINLSNESGTFNFFESDKTKLRADAIIRMGVNFGAVGSEELVTTFRGTGERVRYRRGSVDFTIVDKWTPLSERLVGDATTPLEYVGSNYLVSDIVWWLVTSHGGFDATQSTSNPDIDYDAFSTYASVFSEDSVFINASFDGIKITEALRKISRMTDSSMFTAYTNSETKLSFNRFTQTSSEVLTLTPSDGIVDLQLEIDDRDMINRMTVFADYSITSDDYATVVFDESSVSVDSFGIREDLEKDENVWYVGSATAQNFAQRITLVKDSPYNKVMVRTHLMSLASQAGDALEVDDSLLGFGQSFRVKKRSFNMDTGQVNLEGDASAFFNGFTLDVDSLDHPDRLLL
jgi:hypothetical protein